jgi:hypothetical protein
VVGGEADHLTAPGGRAPRTPPVSGGPSGGSGAASGGPSAGADRCAGLGGSPRSDGNLFSNTTTS